MILVQSQTEMTTAVTDLLLAAIALAAILRLLAIKTTRVWKRALWVGLMLLLVLSGILGAAAHGLVMTEQTHSDLWRVLNLLLVLLISCFGLAAILDWLGRAWMLRIAPLLLALALGVYGSLYLLGGTFLWVMLYEAAIMATALAVYLYLAWRRAIVGAWLVVAGLVITVAAAAVQTMETLSLRLIWEFDHNGLFHLTQIAGVFFLIEGVVRALAGSLPESHPMGRGRGS